MIKRRIERLRTLLSRRQLDALLVTLPANRRYLSGFTPDDSQFGESSGCLFISAHAAFLLTDFRYEITAREQSPYYETVIYHRGLAVTLAQICKSLRIKRLGFEAEALLFVQYQNLRGELDGVDMIPTLDLLLDLRAAKDQSELAATEKSLALMESVLDQVMAGPLVGRTEKDVALQIVRAVEDAGAESVAFPPIVASGPNAAEPHAEPGPRVIGENETLLFDVGARLDGYCSDISRTMWTGDLAAAPDTFKVIYSTVRTAQLAVLEAILPGMLGMEADEVARSIIGKAGFGDRFGHSLGHGVGLATHENPSLSPRSGALLEPGMVFTIEPGIYLPGWGGVRLEIMAVMEEEGCRQLGGLNRFYEL